MADVKVVPLRNLNEYKDHRRGNSSKRDLEVETVSENRRQHRMRFLPRRQLYVSQVTLTVDFLPVNRGDRLVPTANCSTSGLGVT